MSTRHREIAAVIPAPYGLIFFFFLLRISGGARGFLWSTNRTIAHRVVRHGS
jgi:hypothetical protein